MTDPDTTPPDATGHPEHWTQEARDTFDEVLAELPDLQGAAHAQLVQACELIAASNGLEAVARADGYVSRGSTGQAVAHPCTVESRLSRTAAANVLRSLRPDQSGRREAAARRAAKASHAPGSRRGASS